MRNLLILFCSLFLLQSLQAQDFVTDDTLESVVMVNDNELKILYFTAAWCGPCKMMAPIMASIDKDNTIPVTIYKMDTDKNKADDMLKVRSIPTYYFIKNGSVMGISGGGKSKKALEQLIAKYDAMKGGGQKLAYSTKKSAYSIIAGTHPTLTEQNIEPFWYDAQELTKISKSIYENLTDSGDLACALNLANRSIELAPFTANLETRAHILQKQGNVKEARKAAKTARDFALKAGESTALIDALIEKL